MTTYDDKISQGSLCRKEGNFGRFPGVLVAGSRAQPVLLNKILHSLIKT